ncbi:hypothetical protein DdX_21536 [Ditylenchus destructor]|uniref:DUF4242 domain-containing protein n=1 Tax=Ditylenchus destructor TaxID=166010 RepID=A0AAD4MFJ5_9BILA|nr:hypothetical protein DdX_21536 [Ditylenchus destructor]
MSRSGTVRPPGGWSAARPTRHPWSPPGASEGGVSVNKSGEAGKTRHLCLGTIGPGRPRPILTVRQEYHHAQIRHRARIPGAGKLTPSDLKAISQKSCGVLSSMGTDIQWIHSYVTDDRVYCVYQATDEALVRRARGARRLPGQPRGPGLQRDRPGHGRVRRAAPSGLHAQFRRALGRGDGAHAGGKQHQLLAAFGRGTDASSKPGSAPCRATASSQRHGAGHVADPFALGIRAHVDQHGLCAGDPLRGLLGRHVAGVALVLDGFGHLSCVLAAGFHSPEFFTGS